MELHEISKLDNKKHPERIVESKMKKRMKPYSLTSLNNLDDGCLMHILSFLSPIPGKIGFFFASITLVFSYFYTSLFNSAFNCFVVCNSFRKFDKLFHILMTVLCLKFTTLRLCRS